VLLIIKFFEFFQALLSKWERNASLERLSCRRRCERKDLVPFPFPRPLGYLCIDIGSPMVEYRYTLVNNGDL